MLEKGGTGDYHMIAPVPVKQPWRIWLNSLHESSMNLLSNHNKTKQIKTTSIFNGIYCSPHHPFRDFTQRKLRWNTILTLSCWIFYINNIFAFPIFPHPIMRKIFPPRILLPAYTGNERSQGISSHHTDSIPLQYLGVITIKLTPSSHIFITKCYHRDKINTTLPYLHDMIDDRCLFHIYKEII